MFTYLKQRIELVRFYSLYARSASAIERWQSNTLNTLIGASRRNVPLYRELYAALPEKGIQHMRELPRLPIIDKRTFLNRQTEEYVDNSRPLFVPWKSTSGTTGEPLTFLPGLRYGNQDYADFTCFRFLLGAKKLGDLRRTRIARIKMSADRRAYRLFISTKDFLSDVPKAVAALARFRPEVIESFPSVLMEIAHEVSAGQSRTLLFPPYVVSYGEILTKEAREFISKSLRTEVYDRYGLEELGVVGIECRMHDGFHPLPESSIVEIVDTEGNTARTGEEGRVVVTSLTNYSMPFIRYDTGDRGHMIAEPCVCGLSTPRFWIRGRERGPALELGGRHIIQLEFDVALAPFMHSIRRYQVTKTGMEELTVRIVPGASYTSAIAHDVRKQLASIVGPEVSILIKTAEAILARESGKSDSVRDES